MTQAQDEGLLRRWSRRKQQSTLEVELEDSQAELELTTEELPDQAMLTTDSETPAEAEIPVLTDSDMPPIESLTEDSDFSGFMSSGVSDELRNLALKKLFAAPSFNLRDGLDEYDEDYTYFEKLGDIVTADMKHRIELEEAEKQEKLAAEQALDESDIEITADDQEAAKQVETESDLIASEDDEVASQDAGLDIAQQQAVDPESSDNSDHHG